MAWQAFKEYYSEHHVLMDGDDEHAVALKQRLIVVLQSDFKWFAGQATQWVQIGDDDEDAVLKGSGDKLCFVMKARAKMFSRTDRFVGCLCITGPPGGGKGTVLYECRMFGGDGRRHLCHSMGAGYFFDEKVRGAEDCKPVLTGNAGATIAYSDEYPNKQMNPETLKPLICMRGGMGSGRFGGARETQDTSFDITATPFGVGNYALRLPYNTKGLAEKIYNVSPDYLFKPVDECTQPNHVAADEDYIQSLTSGEFAAECTWWLRQLFPFVHDPKFVKGRDVRPMPAGVRANMQVTTAAGTN